MKINKLVGIPRTFPGSAYPGPAERMVPIGTSSFPPYLRPMHIRANASLRAYNTFGIDQPAEHLVEIDSVPTLRRVLRLSEGPYFVLGGGSNVLLTRPVGGYVLLNRIYGRSIISEDEDRVRMRFGGGENWHGVVLHTLERGYGGLENLSLIPGTVGASPIQNIGAYGVELKDVFVQLEAMELATGELHTFDAQALQFGYRDSFFKRAGKGRFFIVSVDVELRKRQHELRTDYGAIKQELAKSNITNPTPKDISDAVIAIRRSKLPDPAEIGNSGSFFKNPEVDAAAYERLLAEFPDLVAYALPNGQYKIPAGWLIERAGWKGKRVGNTGSHAKQALVLVNYGAATGAEIRQLADAIQRSILAQFGIALQCEVNIM